MSARRGAGRWLPGLWPALAILALATPAGAVSSGSVLALPLLTGHDVPELVLAQRAITRSWGPSEDSSYVTVDVPGWKSAGLAGALSLGLPGAGQAYVGRKSALIYALAEAAGWTAHTLFLDRAHDYRDRSQRFAGVPTDSAAGWSFARWAEITGGDPADLQRIYAADPGAFYALIGRDASYLAGWRGDPSATRGTFMGLVSQSGDNYDRAHRFAVLLWINHLVSAVQAVREARDHDLPLQQNLQLKLKSSWRAGSPSVVAALERRF